MSKVFASSHRSDKKRKIPSSASIPSKMQTATFTLAEAYTNIHLRTSLLQVLNNIMKHAPRYKLFKDGLEVIMASPSVSDAAKWKQFSDLYELGRLTDAVEFKHNAREASKITAIQNLISGFTSSVSHYQSQDEEKEIREYYCDVGSGNGDLSIAIGDSLLFPRKRIYMVDIPEWMEKKHRTRENMVLLDPSQADFELPFPDGRFRVMSCFMSIHHFKYPARMLEQIYKKLKEGGYLIIREHDCTDVVVEQSAHFEHRCHYMIEEKQKLEEFEKCYYASYTSADALTTQLQSIGFQFIRKMEDAKPAHRNPSQHYWMLFRKKKKERQEEEKVEVDSIRITIDTEAKQEDETMIC